MNATKINATKNQLLMILKSQFKDGTSYPKKKVVSLINRRSSILGDKYNHKDNFLSSYAEDQNVPKEEIRKAIKDLCYTMDFMRKV